MTKYIINNDDVIRIGQKLYQLSSNSPETDFLKCKDASKDYEKRLIENGVDAEIFHDGNDQDTTALMQGDLVQSKQESELKFILISTQLMPLQEAKYALDAYSKNQRPNVVKIPNPKPTLKASKQYDKRDHRMTKDIDTLKALVDNAENQGWETIDGVNYGASHTWREVAQLALDLADQQEWFDRYDNKYFN